MNRQKILLILLIVLTLSITFTELVLADNSDINVEILRAVNKASPGETVSLLCKLSNNAEQAQEIEIKMKLPAGWKLLIPVDRIYLTPGETETVILSVFTGENSRAGRYKLAVKFTGINNESIYREFIINIEEINRLTVDCLRSPEHVLNGENYRAEFTVCNRGNTEQEIELAVSDNLGFPLKLNPETAYLKAGENIKVTVDVTVPEDYHKSRSQFLQLTAYSTEEKNLTVYADINVKIIPHRMSTENIYYTLPLKLTLGSKYNLNKTIWQLKGKGKLSEKSSAELSFNFNNQRNYLKYSSPAFSLTAGDHNVLLSPLLNLGNKNYIKIKKKNKERELNLLYCNDKTLGAKTAWKLNKNDKLAVQYLNLPEADNLLTVRNSCKYNSGFKMDIEYGKQFSSEISDALYLKGNYCDNNLDTHLYYRREDKGFLDREEERENLRLYTSFPFLTSCFSSLSFSRDNDSKKIGCSLNRQKENSYRGLRLKKSLSDGEYRYNVYFKKSLTAESDLYQKLGLCSCLQDDNLKKYTFYNVHLNSSLSNSTFTAYLNLKYPLQAEDKQEIGGGLYLYRRLDNNDTFAAGLNCNNLLEHDWRFYLQGKHKYSDGNILRYRGEVDIDDSFCPRVETELVYTIPLAIPIKKRADLGMLAGYIKDSKGSGVKDTIIKLNGQTIVSDKNGYFLFPAVPCGKHYLRVKKAEEYKKDYLLLPSDVLAVNVKANKKLVKEFTLVKGVDLSGRLILARKDLNDDLQKLSLYGQAEIDEQQLCKGIIIELIHRGRAYRKVSNEKGEFNFTDLAPGKWNVKVHRNGLSELYNLKPQEKCIQLKEGEECNINIKIIPVRRTIHMQEGGSVEYQD